MFWRFTLDCTSLQMRWGNWFSVGVHGHNIPVQDTLIPVCVYDEAWSEFIFPITEGVSLMFWLYVVLVYLETSNAHWWWICQFRWNKVEEVSAYKRQGRTTDSTLTALPVWRLSNYFSVHRKSPTQIVKTPRPDTERPTKWATEVPYAW